MLSFVVIITLKHWSNAVQTANPCLSGLQSKELTGCDETVIFCKSVKLPTIPWSMPSLSTIFRFSG